MLAGKYIKYSENITFETFKRIIDRLEDSGWEYNHKLIGEEMFRQFQLSGYICYCNQPNQYSFYSKHVIQNTDVELKVSDILNVASNDLVVGEIYRIKHEFDDTYIISTYEGMHDPNRINGIYISNMDSRWKFAKDTLYILGREILSASTLEKKWLKICIKANTFIPESDICKYNDDGLLISNEWEVGKWYRLGEWISKFISIKEGYQFYGERINIQSKFYDNKGWLSLKKYTPELITDLSEIQQYLPEDHPDKIREYKALPFPDKDYFEAEVIEDINPDNLNPKGNCPFIPKGTKTWFSNLDCIVHISKKSSRTIHPENNRWCANIPANYFKVIEKTEEFKVGDWVVWKCSNDSTPYKICKIVSEKEWYVEFNKTTSRYTHPFNEIVRKATQAEIDAVINPQQLSIKDYYFEVSSQEEADKVYEYLKSIGEKVSYINENAFYRFPNYKYVVTRSDNSWWVGCATSGKTKKLLSDIISSENKSFTLNTWYKVIGSTVLCFYTGTEKGIGFDNNNTWSEVIRIHHPEKWEIASESEVKERLLAYAEEKYPKGTHYKSAYDGMSGGVVDRIIWNDGNIQSGPKWIFNKESGKWAEIVSKPNEPESFDNCKIWIGNNPELSRKVQEKLFELGYKWADNSKRFVTNGQALFICGKSISHITDNDSLYFKRKEAKEIFPEDLGITSEAKSYFPFNEWDLVPSFHTSKETSKFPQLLQEEYIPLVEIPTKKEQMVIKPNYKLI